MKNIVSNLGIFSMGNKLAILSLFCLCGGKISFGDAGRSGPVIWVWLRQCVLNENRLIPVIYSRHEFNLKKSVSGY